MAHFDLDSTQLDGVNAFCQSPMDEEVYCELPDGFMEFPELQVPAHSDSTNQKPCLRLRKALYGLRCSPLLWQREFTSACLEYGLSPILEDQCLFAHQDLLLFIYVDDIVILS